MYLYFDKTGTLKEIINDEALRQGNYGINKLYIYVDGQNIEYVSASYLLPNNSVVSPDPFYDVENVQIPFDRKRDLRFFKYWTKYPFIVVDLDNEVDGNGNIVSAGPLDQAGTVHASLIATIEETGAELDLGELNFEVERNSTLQAGFVASEEYLSIGDYKYLKSVIDTGLANRWKKFVGTTEERLAAIKNTSTLYVDTTTGLDYIWNGSSFIALGEHIDLEFNADSGTNHINSIYYKSNSNEGTYYPTKLVTFNYIASNEKEILTSALSGLNLTYNTNYLYYNTYNKQLYSYNGSTKLILTGALQNAFTLTYEEQGDTYDLALADLPQLVNALESIATNFIIFEFSGGDYDGRRYLMNYNYDEVSDNYNLVCVDFDIHLESGVGYKITKVEKFRLDDISLSQTDLRGQWYEATTDTAQAVDSDTFIIGSTTYNIPSDVSDLNNDLGYLTPSSSTITSMQTAINGKQDTLIPGNNITIINNEISATDTTYESKEAVNGGTDLSLVTTGEKYTWNNKQNPLPSTSGNNNKYLHINDTTGNLEWSEVGFITGAFTYIGTTTTPLSDGSTTNPITIGGESVTATNGNVVFYGDAEYVWTGSAWEELGNKNQATSSVLGNIKLGSDTTIDGTASKVYPIQLNSSGQAFVYVPWTDNNTTYNIATSSVAGLVKSSTTGTTANRDYVVQVNNDGTMKVNVPWTDTDTTYSVATGSVLGLVKSQTTGTTANRDYAVEVNANGTMKVNVPWVNTTYASESAAQGGTTVSLVTTGEKYTWNNKQDTLSSASVNTGTIETAIGFNNNGELVKGSIPSGVDNISIVNALPSVSNAQNNMLYKLNNDLYALTETEQVAPVISYSNGTLTITCDYDAESIELYADNTLIDTISINGGNN